MALDIDINIFLRIISHELRTPLTIIRGYADLITDESQRCSLPLIVGWANTIEQAVLRLTAIVDNNLTWLAARHAPSDLVRSFSPVELNAAVEAAISDLSKMAEEAAIGIQLVEEDQCLVFGNGALLQQMCVNLLSNAIKFSNQGGMVVITLGKSERNFALCAMKITDEGIGINQEEQEKVFLPFYQVDSSDTRSYPGCGLGLAVVAEIVNLHKGHLVLQSVPQQGSTFIIFLPMWQEEGER